MIAIYIIIFLYFLWYLPHMWVNRFKAKKENIIVNHVETPIPCTLLIPFFNEEQRILPTIEAIKLLQPQPMEVFFIDDHSTDSTSTIILQNGFSVITNQGKKGKKSALTQGIEMATNEIIATTDADCVMANNWLELLYKSHQKKALTFGLVEFNTNGKIFSYYQWMENRALMAVGQGSYHLGYPLMCNGANLMFEKEIWKEVGGYTENEKIQGGDDVFLLQEIWLKDRSLISLCPDAIVYTSSRPNFSSFMRQRRRWANKGLHYKPLYAKVFPLVTALLNLGILISLIYLLFIEQWAWAITFLIIKSIVDYLLMISPKSKGALCVSFPMVVQFQLFQMLYPFFLPFFKSDWRKETTENE